MYRASRQRLSLEAATTQFSDSYMRSSRASYFIFVDVKQYSSVSQFYFPIEDVLVSGGKPGYWHLFGLNTIGLLNALLILPF